MKTKNVIFLFLTLIMLETKGQNGHLYPTVMPVKENGYTNWEFESFALGGSNLSIDYKKATIDIVKQFFSEIGLYATDENGNPIKQDEEWIRFIFDPSRTWSEDRTYQNGFWNSHQSADGRKVVFYWDKRPFHGPVLVLHFEGYELDLGKRVCANLVKVHYTLTPRIDQKPQQPRRENPNATNFDNGWQQVNESPSNYQAQHTFTLPDVQSETWLHKNKGWLIPVTAFVLTSATGFVAHDKNHYWYLWFPKGKPVDAPPVGDRDSGNPQDGQPVGPQEGQGVGGK